MSLNGKENIRIPAGISEGDLLDLVEGRLREPRLTEVESAIADMPSLQRLVRDMRADREAVRGLPALEAPAFMLPTVRAVLDEDTIRTLRMAEVAADAPLPRSTIIPARSRARIPFHLSLRPHQLALAAGLVLLAGGAALVWRTIIQDARVEPTDSGNRVVRDDARSTPEVAPGGPRLARHEPPVETRHDPAPDLPAETALANATVPAQPTVTIDRALALAAEGRLIIRVTTAEPTRATDVLDRLARQPSTRLPWRLEHTPSPEVVAAVQRVLPAEIQSREIAYAGDPSNVPSIHVQPRAPKNYVYAGLSRLDPDALMSLLQAASTDGVTAEFVECPDPLPVPAPVIDVDAVLWWTAPPQGWTAWAEVPIVVTPE